MIEIGALKFRTLNIERLSVPNGITCIIGENGSGKSTLARLLCGYYEAKTGSVIADGVPVRSLDTGYVPEFFDNGIIFENVADEITSPLRFAFEDNATISDRLNAAAELLGIEDLLGKETENISGGEKACVALATAIISSPRILVLDEPDSHLDRKTSERIMAALKKLHTADAENKSRRTSGIPYIINCTQNTDIAADADFVIFMEDGRAVYSGTPTAVFEELKLQNSPFLPTPMRIDAALENVANPADTATANTPSAATAANVANAATEKATPTANAATENCSGITPKLELKGLKVSRGSFTLNADAVFESGVHIITGDTGSGKSTLAYALSESGLANAAGDIIFAGIEKRVFLMQFAAYHITETTVEDEIISWGKSPEATENLLKYLGLSEKRKSDPAKLSAGELKKLHLACILSGDADLIILDEPFSTLDIAGKEAFASCRQFADAQSRRPRIIIIFTHEKTVLPHADFIWEITDDKLCYLGKPSDTRALRDWDGAPEYIRYALSKGAVLKDVGFGDAVCAVNAIERHGITGHENTKHETAGHDGTEHDCAEHDGKSPSDKEERP